MFMVWYCVQVFMTDAWPRAKQYKTHIRRWGLEKKVKGREMRAIVRINRKRKELDGKESEFRVRNQVVPEWKIRRYTKRTETITETSLSQPSPIGEVFHPLSKLSFLIVCRQHLLLRT